VLSNPPTESSNPLTEQAAQSADRAIQASQRVTNRAFDSLAGSVQDLKHEVAPMLNRATGEVSAFAQRGLDAVRQGSQQLQDQARRASDSSMDYVRHEPLKSILIAAATGAALMALVGMLSRSRDRA